MSKKILSVLIVMVSIILIVCSGCIGNNKNSKTNAVTNNPTSKATTMSTTAKPTETQASTTTNPSSTAKSTNPGTNVALNKQFEVSSETGETHVQWGWSSAYINDGVKEFKENENVGWTTNVGVVKSEADWADEWVLIDLGEVISIDKVVVYPIDRTASFFPIDFHVEVSTDKAKFTTVSSITGDTSAKDKNFTPKVLSFDATNARYVKLVITKPYDVPSPVDGYLVQMAEIEVYSAPSGNAGVPNTDKK